MQPQLAADGNHSILGRHPGVNGDPREMSSNTLRPKLRLTAKSPEDLLELQAMLTAAETCIKHAGMQVEQVVRVRYQKIVTLLHIEQVQVQAEIDGHGAATDAGEM